MQRAADVIVDLVACRSRINAMNRSGWNRHLTLSCGHEFVLPESYLALIRYDPHLGQDVICQKCEHARFQNG